MWHALIDVNTSKRTHTHTHTDRWIPGTGAVFVYICIYVVVYETHTHTQRAFSSLNFAPFSLQCRSRARDSGGRKKENARQQQHQQQQRRHTLLVVVSFRFLSLSAPAKIAFYLYQQQSGLRKIHTVWPQAAIPQNTASSLRWKIPKSPANAVLQAYVFCHLLSNILDNNVRNRYS